MSELSPAAQAVWEAFNEDEAGVFVDYGDKLAAALRAAAIYSYCPVDRRRLAAIADELEGVNRSGNLKAGLTRSPAAGEVAELVAWLRGVNWDRQQLLQIAIRAADLLERLGPPQPVPVSERLPGPGDCDAEGRCWWWYPEVPDKTYGYWAYEDDAVPERALNEQPTHWLSVHALPLPS